MSKIEQAYQAMKDMEAQWKDAVKELGAMDNVTKELEKKYCIIRSRWNKAARQGRLKLTKLKNPEGNLLLFLLKNRTLNVEVRCGCCGKPILEGQAYIVWQDDQNVLHHTCISEYADLMREAKVDDIKAEFRLAQDHNIKQQCSYCGKTRYAVKFASAWVCRDCHPYLPKKIQPNQFETTDVADFDDPNEESKEELE